MHDSRLYELFVRDAAVPGRSGAAAFPLDLTGGGARLVFLSLCLPEFDLRDPQPPSMMEVVAFYRRLGAQVRETPGLRLASEAADAPSAPDEGDVLVALALEGCHLLGGEVAWLDSLLAVGVGVIGVAHSFHDGLLVDPQTGRLDGNAPWPPPGPPSPLRETSVLSDRGRRLVEGIIARGLTLDVSHLPPTAFWEVVGLARGRTRLVASHANARALCDNPRNLTDAQLLAIRDSGGVVGVCLHAPMLSETGAADLDDVVEQLLYLHRLLGAAHVALGTDLGGMIDLPHGIAAAADLAPLADRLRQAGLPAEDIGDIMGRNAFRALPPGSRAPWPRVVPRPASPDPPDRARALQP